MSKYISKHFPIFIINTKHKPPKTASPFSEPIKIKSVKYNYTPESSIFGQIYSAFVFTNLNNERHSWHLFWQGKYSITVWQSIVFWSLMFACWSADVGCCSLRIALRIHLTNLIDWLRSEAGFTGWHPCNRYWASGTSTRWRVSTNAREDLYQQMHV